MKILFETVNNKKVLKEFENGTLAKNFIVKNKDKLSKAQIMEGPLGSKTGGFHPIKAFKALNKHRKISTDIFDSELKKMGMDRFDLMNDIKKYVSKQLSYKFEMPKNLQIGSPYKFGENNLKVLTDVLMVKDPIEDNENWWFIYEDEKFEMEKLPLVKLTKYIETKKQIPSLESIIKYVGDLMIKKMQPKMDERYNKIKGFQKYRDDVNKRKDFEDF